VLEGSRGREALDLQVANRGPCSGASSRQTSGLKDTPISGGGGAREVGGDADSLMCAHDRLYGRVREAYKEEDSLVLLAAAHKRQTCQS